MATDEEKKKIKHVVEEIAPEGAEKATSEVKKEEKKVEEEPVVASSVESAPSSSESAPASQPAEPEIIQEEKKNTTKVVVFTALLTAVITAALAGGIYVYLTGIGKLEKVEVEATPTPVPTVAPSAKPEATTSASPSPTPMKLSTYKVQILNGSGKIGEANKVRALLEKEGFKITNTGNAASFDFEETIIQTKKSVPASVVDIIKEALSGSYVTSVGDTLPTSSAYDIVITVGSK